MKYIGISLIYIAFFGCIAAACWITKSALPLWTLILTPSLDFKNDNCE